MRRQLVLLLIAILLSAFPVKARSLTSLKLGANISSFRTEAGKSKPGLCFGFGKEFYPIRSCNGFFGFGLDYQQKKYILENRTWPGGMDPNDSDIIMGDINVNISYIEIPLKFGYSVHINNRYTSSIYAGYSLSIPLKNHTKVSNRKSILLGPDERGSYEFDYIREDWDHAMALTNSYVGVRLSYKRFAIIISYARALSNTEGITNLTVRDKIDTFEISAAFLF